MAGGEREIVPDLSTQNEMSVDTNRPTGIAF